MLRDMLDRPLKLSLAVWVCAFLLLGGGAGCLSREKTRLSVFIAGSLIIPADELERVYEEQHPDIDVEMEAHGSIQVIRHVTEIHDQIDVVIPADYSLIPMLMYGNNIPQSEQPYADWVVTFATNQLSIAYTEKSLYADEINSQNWHEILSRDDVRLGLSDPRMDASGYRTLMIIQLAEDYYQDPTIFEQIFLGQFKQPIRVEKNKDQEIIHIPEVLEPAPDSHIILRGTSVALISLLETGDIDYAFQYQSVSEQHGFQTLKLPGELNLGEEAFSDDYQKVLVQLDFQRFSTVPPLFTGEVIGYGLTIPANAPHPEEALDFILFLLGPEGKAVFTDNHHPLFEIPVADHPGALPEALQALISPVGQ